MLTDFEYQELIDLLFLEDVEFLEAQQILGLTQEQMEEAIDRLEADGYIKTYTVH
jgi:DNA-binding MarR family transcriptional regulator